MGRISSKFLQKFFSVIVIGATFLSFINITPQNTLAAAPIPNSLKQFLEAAEPIKTLKATGIIGNPNIKSECDSLINISNKSSATRNLVSDTNNLEYQKIDQEDRSSLATKLTDLTNAIVTYCQARMNKYAILHSTSAYWQPYITKIQNERNAVEDLSKKLRVATEIPVINPGEETTEYCKNESGKVDMGLAINKNIKKLEELKITGYRGESGGGDGIVGGLNVAEAFKQLCANPKAAIFGENRDSAQEQYSAIVDKMREKQQIISPEFIKIVLAIETLKEEEGNRDSKLFTTDPKDNRQRVFSFVNQNDTYGGSQEAVFISGLCSVAAITLPSLVVSGTAAIACGLGTLYYAAELGLGYYADVTSGYAFAEKLEASWDKIRPEIGKLNALTFLANASQVKSMNLQANYKIGSEEDGILPGRDSERDQSAILYQLEGGKFKDLSYISFNSFLNAYAEYDKYSEIGKKYDEMYLKTKGYVFGDSSTFAEIDPCFIDRSGVSGALSAFTPQYYVWGNICGTTVALNNLVTSFMCSSAKLLQTQAGLIRDSSFTPPSSLTNQRTDCEALGNWTGTELTDPVQDVVVGSGQFGSMIQTAYKNILRSINIFLIISLIFLAIVNILQIQVNTYAINKVLPGLLLAFIAAQASLFMMRSALEITDQLAGQVVSIGIQSGNENARNDFGGFVTAFSSFPYTMETIAGCPLTKPGYLTVGCDQKYVDVMKVGKLFLNTLFTALTFFMLFILAVQFILRRLIFYFLIPVAPIAVFTYALPPAKNAVWGKWWKTFTGWLFMPFIASFWLWLALIWFSTGGEATGALGALMSYVFGCIALYAAIKTPSQFVGEVKFAGNLMNKWTGMAADKPLQSVQRGLKNGIIKNTPVGSVMRGYNKFAAARKKGEEELLKGNVIKNQTLANTALADAVNVYASKLGRNADHRGRRTEENMKLVDARAKQEEKYMRREAAIHNTADKAKEIEDTIKEEIKARKAENEQWAKDMSELRRKRLESETEALKKEGEVREKAIREATLQAEANLKHQKEFEDEEKKTFESRVKERMFLDSANEEEFKRVKAGALRAETAAVRAEAERNTGITDAQAELDAAKEAKKMSDDAWLEGVRKKTNEIRAAATGEDSYATQRTKLEMARAEATVAEVNRDSKFIEEMKKDAALQDAILKAESLKEASSKELNKTRNKRARDQQVLIELEASLQRTMEDISTARDSTERSRLIELRNNQLETYRGQGLKLAGDNEARKREFNTEFDAMRIASNQATNALALAEAMPETTPEEQEAKRNAINAANDHLNEVLKPLTNKNTGLTAGSLRDRQIKITRGMSDTYMKDEATVSRDTGLMNKFFLHAHDTTKKNIFDNIVSQRMDRVSQDEEAAWVANLQDFHGGTADRNRGKIMAGIIRSSEALNNREKVRKIGIASGDKEELAKIFERYDHIERQQDRKKYMEAVATELDLSFMQASREHTAPSNLYGYKPELESQFRNPDAAQNAYDKIIARQNNTNVGV